MKDILLVTPPFTQLNTPYPGTVYVKGFLNTLKVSSYQMDLGIEVILKIFSEKGLTEMFDFARNNGDMDSPEVHRTYNLRKFYISCIDEVILFLQGKNPSLARRICSERFLPEGSKFDQLDDLEWAFGTMGMQDKAKHLATLFIEDISDFISECIDENFGFSRYAEKLGMSANSFDEMYNALQKPLSYTDQITLNILRRKVKEVQPKILGLSVPFPGNLFSAFRMAQMVKAEFPEIKIAMGGGFPNTELRSMKDQRVFEFMDFITLDDGELPIELLIDHVFNDGNEFKRTWLVENDQLVYKNDSPRHDYKQSEVGTPDYSDLLLDQYISVIEIANPMHTLWSDGRWNKLTMAHGCYWGKCTFCDISLDYIKLYEPLTAKLLVDRMEEMIAQTQERGFHFVDEAAPPALMKALALEILRRKLTVTWWTNVRFEKNFTYDLCVLLQASGCIGVSGGLEVASDRLLALIDKGVTVEQVAQVTRNFTDAGIMVHSYLMYGYPTQTVQETIDSLEMVRQLFEQGVIQSGFWHQFALTAHSPIGQNPEQYHISPDYKDIQFANNDVEFTDATGIDHNQFSYGLKKSLFNFMHGLGFELKPREWFDFKTTNTQIPKNYISNALMKELRPLAKGNSQIIWLGSLPETRLNKNSRNGKSNNGVVLIFEGLKETFEIHLDREKGKWLVAYLEELQISEQSPTTFSRMKRDFEEASISEEPFEMFWFGEAMEELRDRGLVVV